MNVFHKVTRASLVKNRTRTAVTIVGIMLSTALMTAVTASVSTLRRYLVEDETALRGAYHVSITQLENSLYPSVAGYEEVDEITYGDAVGYALAGSTNTYKPYLYIMGIPENFTDLTAVTLISGRMPQSPYEILIPEHLSYNGEVYWGVGDTLDLCIGDRMQDGYSLTQNNPYIPPEETAPDDEPEVLVPRDTRVYTVCGIYGRPEFEEYSAPGYTCLTLDDNGTPDAAYVDVWYTVKHPRRVFETIDKLNVGGDYHANLLMYMGINRHDGFMDALYGLTAILLGLIVFGSVALIYNAFSISVSERTKQFGMLSSIGATKKQLRHMVRYEAFCVSALGIPLGIALGLAGITVTFLCIGGRFAGLIGSVPMRLHVSWIALVLTVLISALTVHISAWIPSHRATKVTAVEAVRQTADIKTERRPIKTPKWVYKLFGLSGVLGQKYFKRSKRRYRATILSLFMSVVLFITASSFTSSLQHSVSTVFDEGQTDLYYWVNTSGTGLLTPQELTELFRQDPNVEQCALVSGASCNAKIRSDTLTPEMVRYFAPDAEQSTLTDVAAFTEFVDDETFRDYLRELHFSEDVYMNAADPQAVVLDSIVLFDKESDKYREFSAVTGKTCTVTADLRRQVDGYEYAGYDGGENGEELFVYHPVGYTGEEDHDLRLSRDKAFFTRELTGTVVHDRPYFSSVSGYIVFLYPMSLQDAVMEGAEPPDTLSYEMLAPDHKAAVLSLHNTLAEHRLPVSALFDVAADRENERSLVLIVKVFCYGFIILISLIAAANVFNSISTNIALRRREFAMLRSIGMTGKALTRMMHYECLLCGTKALAFGLPVSLLTTWLIYAALRMGFEEHFHIPWSAAGIAVCSVFAVVFASMLYAMQKVKHENPMDALKNENY